MWRDVWAGLKWLAKACLALVVLACVLLPLILMTWPDLPSANLTVPAGLSAAWLTFVGMALAIFAVYLAWRLLRALVLYPFGSWNVFGTTTSARLLGLGIAAIITPRAVEKLIMVPAAFLWHLVEGLMRQASSIPLSFSPGPTERTISIQEPLIRLSLMVVDGVAEIGRAFSQAIEGLLTPDVVIALAIWVLAGHLLSTADPLPKETASMAGASRLYRYIKALSPAHRHGIVLTCVFLTGAYLSIAAIVAIPWMHEEKPLSGLSREGLEKILDGILSSAVQPAAPANTVPVVPDDPFAPLSEYLANRAKTTNAFDPIAFQLNVTIANGKEARAKGVGRLQQMPAQISKRAAQMKQAAMSAFDLETATLMSNQERGYFMKEIQRSVSADLQKLEAAQSNCANALLESDKQFRDFSQASIAILSVAGSSNPTESDRASDQQMKVALLAQPLENASRASRAVRESCVTPEFQQTVYAAPVAGSGWGPFGLVARWLLQTKSIPLALITGMLGFGLLGSAIATFVRGGERGQVSLAAEVTSVLVRGLSAAVVVFLAVKGGLAIFSASENEPNAYVVFLTCLVGAVFSEDVWNWAHSKFLDNLSSKSTQEKKERTMAEGIEASVARGAKKDEDLR
jgi:hypothetical protein